ncbi:MAG TPA: lipase family protein, partial [Treponemataceae bacterium]|nr:lipase family protein [Treponemataceae bacterium]
MQYYPVGYDGQLAQELGTLVAYAYDQFKSFEEGTEWSIPAPYEMVSTLSYPWKKTGSFDSGGKVAAIFKKLKSTDKAPEVPIGFVARKDGDLYVAFRGTETANEWIGNFNQRLVDFFIPGYGNVHEGFQNSYLSVRDDVIAAVTGAGGAKRLYVTGHSLGAALATFATCDIEANAGKTALATYTYGSPRPGDAAFSAAYGNRFGGRTFRVENSSDIVPEVPFPAQFLGFLGGYFAHVDTPVMINVQKNDVEKNHAIATYVEALAGGARPVGFF